MTSSAVDDEIREKVRALLLDHLSYREIADKLANEQGYDRALVIRVIHNMKGDRHIPTEYTVPIAFTLIGAFLLYWGSTASDPDTVSITMRGLKLALYCTGGVAFLPALFAVAYQFYDRIPGLENILGPVFHKRRMKQSDVIELDNQYLRGNLSNNDYESRLLSILGPQRGRSHYRYMRNYKHFGLD
jgi:hypothetical protein